MTHLLSETPSIINQYIAELRDKQQQLDSLRFRQNLERIATMIGYEISKQLSYQEREVETPLGIAQVEVPDSRIILATILRAGLPMHQGLLHVFDDADSAFVSAYRRHHKSGNFEIEIEYLSCPNLEDSILIVSDAMLATGASLTLTAKALLEHGQPKQIHFVSAIASTAGLEYAKRLYPDAHFWIAALDDELTARSYIVPGLGDAGDLSYGEKLQE